jgi:hypothetical protein
MADWTPPPPPEGYKPSASPADWTPPPPPAGYKPSDAPQEKELTYAGAALKTADWMAQSAGEFLHKEGAALAGAMEAAPVAAAVGQEVGGDIGAAAGFALGGPAAAIVGLTAGKAVGGVVGGVGGAYAGGAAGQSATVIADYLIDKIAPGSGTKRTAKEAAESINAAGVSMAEAEGIGHIIGAGLGAAGKKLFPSIEERAALAKTAPLKAKALEAAAAVRTALSANILPSMEQITQSRPIAAAAEAISRVPFLGSRVMAMRAELDAGYQAMRNGLINTFGPDMKDTVLGTQTAEKVQGVLTEKIEQRQKDILAEQQRIFAKHGESAEYKELGQKFDDLRAVGQNLARKAVGDEYSAVDKSISPSQNQLSATNLEKKAQEIHDELYPTPTSYPASLQKVVTDLKEGPRGRVVDEEGKFQLFDQFGNTPPAAEAAAKRTTYTYKEFSNIISDLTSRIKEEAMKSGAFGSAQVGATTTEGRYLIQMKEAALKDRAAFSETIPEDVKKMQDVADANYKEYKGKYANDDVNKAARAVVKNNPEQVYKMFISPNKPSSVARLKAIVGEEGMSPFRRKFTENLVTGTDGKLLPGPAIMRNIDRMGPEMMKEMLTPGQMKDLLDSANNLQTPKFIESQIEKKLRGLIASKGGVMAPEDVVRLVTHGDSVTIKALTQIMTPKGMIPYKRAILEEALGGPQEVNTLAGAIPTPTSIKASKKLEAYGDTIKYLFSPEEIADVKKVLSVKSLLESSAVLNAQASGTAAQTTANAYTTALFGFAGGSFFYHGPAAIAADAAIVIGPDLMSRFMVSKSGRRLLIEGMSDGAAQNIMLGSKISAFILNAKRGQYNEEASKLGRAAEPDKSLPQRISPETRAQSYDTRIDGAPAEQPQTLQGQGLLGVQ